MSAEARTGVLDMITAKYTLVHGWSRSSFYSSRDDEHEDELSDGELHVDGTLGLCRRD